jgi:hypothetical protein
VRTDANDHVSTTGSIELRNSAPERLLLVAEALAVSVALPYDERRIGEAFDRVEPVVEPQTPAVAGGQPVGSNRADW